MSQLLSGALALSLILGLAQVTAAAMATAPGLQLPYAGASPASACRPHLTALQALSIDPQAGRFVPGVIIVKLRPRVPGADSVLDLHDLRLQCSFGDGATHLLSVARGTEESLAAALRQDPEVESAQPDYIRRLSVVPSDPMIGGQWALSKINAPAAWDITTGSSDVIIAVVDSGIDLGHPELKDKLVEGYDFANGDASPADDNGHGTHVAGIAASSANNAVGIAGVSWGARIMPIKVTDATGSTSDSIVSTAIRFAADRGARIINLSLGGPEDSVILREAVEYAAARGALIVVAAGNCFKGGADCRGVNPTYYPAAYPQVMAVGATGSTDQHASYSETGAYISVVAPGGDPKPLDTDSRSTITSTYWRGVAPSGYSSLAGTSQAAPHVSGLAALVWSVNPRLKAAEVRTIIENSAADLGVTGRDQVFGAGRIDAHAAVLAASSGTPTPTPAASPTPTPSPTATLLPTPIPVTTTIPVATGGSLRLGNVSVHIPARVVDDESQVTVRLGLFTPAKLPEGMVSGSASFELTMQGGNGRAISKLGTPVRLQVQYTAVDLANAGGDPNGVVMGVLDPGTGLWEKLPTTAEPATRMVTADVGHLTKFSVLNVMPPPRLDGPEGGILTVDLAPRLEWTVPQGTTQYQIQVLPANQDGPAINLIRNTETVFAVPAPVFGQGNYILLPGMTYTWRVRTTTFAARLNEDDPGWSVWVARTFRTGPPTSATISAISGAQATTLTPSVAWSNANRSIFYYEVQVSRDPLFETHPVRATAPVYWNLVHGGVTAPANSYTVPPAFPLDPRTQHYWRVRPRVQGDGVAVAWSDTWSFRTP